MESDVSRSRCPLWRHALSCWCCYVHRHRPQTGRPFSPEQSPTQLIIDCIYTYLPHTSGRCPIIRSPSRKVSPGRQFTGKNSPRPAAARAVRIFTGKLSARGDFWGRSYNGKTFYGAGDILIRGRHIKSVIISPCAGGDILMWHRLLATFPAAAGRRENALLSRLPLSFVRV